MPHADRRVLLLTPPWRPPELGNLGQATLKAILEHAALPTDTLHGTHLWPPSAAHHNIRWQYSHLYYAPHLHEEVSSESCVEATLDTYWRDLVAAVGGPGEERLEETFTRLGMDAAAIRQDVREEIGRAAICADRCVRWAARTEYDVLGMSCVFEFQLPAALLIARKLRAVRPDMAIVLGGAACLGPASDELVRAFPELDAVCHSEGDDIVVPLVLALRESAAHPKRRDALLAAVPGLSWVDARGRTRRNPSPPLVTDLDRLPIPDYTDFVRQLEESPFGAAPPKLFFETSRGCWWGQKHPCSFCGLNPAGLLYRRKSPERAVREIQTLYERYPSAPLYYATDNILDLGYLGTVLPRLAGAARSPARPLRLFFEVKSNLRPAQVKALADAGIRGIQPGIESLSDEILRLMGKGATGLRQVQAVKLFYQEGIQHQYNLIVRNPLERPEHYGEMIDMVPYLWHLPAPSVSAMLLERFSPYFTSPERYGIRNIRPPAYARLMFGRADVDLGRLAYVFDYDADFMQDRDLLGAHRILYEKVDQWRAIFEPGLAHSIDAGTLISVEDRRPAWASRGMRRFVVTGVARAAFRFLEVVRPRHRIGQELDRIDGEVLDALLDTWQHRRWLYRNRRGHAVGVLPRRPYYLAPRRLRPLADAR